MFPPCDIRDVAVRYQEELLKENPDEVRPKARAPFL
jgi:hypothetical protein